MINEDRRSFLNFGAGVFISMATPLFSLQKRVDKKLDKGTFLHGVASGDPLQDKVIIWTRVTPKTKVKAIHLLYEVAQDKDFKTIFRSESVVALQKHDFTVKIDVQDLEPDTYYFYRFKTSDNSSIVGRTRTLDTSPDKVTMAIFSCANYTSGYFNVYNDACKFDTIDLALHLGDYIYEYGMFDENQNKAYGTKNAKKIGRALPKNNDKELFSLKDYRLRYALYHEDPDLQKVHAKIPFICIWDDHEIANDAYKTGCSDERDDVEIYLQRKKSAIQAYYEWLPIRPPSSGDMQTIYRAFHFGTLLSLYMLDTRLISRDKSLSYQDYFKENNFFNIKKFQTDMQDERRELLGKSQFSWLKKELKSSPAKWQCIAQQVKLSPSYIPLEVMELIQQYNDSTQSKEKKLIKERIFTIFEEITHIKMRESLKDATLTKEEKMRLNANVPYNLDAWDGYSQEREKMYALLQRYGTSNIVFSGDAHYSWSSKLIDKFNSLVGFELGVTSVSSPGLEEDFDLKNSEKLKQLEDSIGIFDKKTLYNNQTDRGYLIVEILSAEIKAHWRYVDTVNDRNYKILEEKSTLMRIASDEREYHYKI